MTKPFSISLYFFFMIPLLASAEGSGVWDTAFPESRYYNDNDTQIYGGMAEIVVGTGLTVYAFANLDELSLGVTLNREAYLAARKDIAKTDPRNASLLDLRDSRAQTVEYFKTEIQEIDDYMRYGKQVTVGYDKNNLPLTETHYPDAAEKVFLRQGRSSLSNDLRDAENALTQAHATASPAEKILQSKKSAILQKIRSGEIGKPETWLIRRARLRVAGETIAIAGSIFMVVDGGLRLVNAINGRDSGISPAIRLGKTSAQKIFSFGSPDTNDDNSSGSESAR